MTWEIPLAEVDIGEQEIAAVVDVLKGRWLTMNGVTEAFEEEFAHAMGVGHALAVTNGTAALHLAHMALDIGPGDEVICPALTFVATANASRYVGATVVFADSVSQRDLTVDPDSIEAMITPKTKAISVVHYGGFPCDMGRIRQIARKHDLKIIEDCAHAPLAWWKSETGERRYVGSLGDIGCFSFFSNKNMTTGEGGMVTTNDDEVARRIRLLRSHGMTTLTYDRHRGHASGYDVVVLGYNYRIDEIRSALGRVQLRNLERNNQARRSVFTWYVEALQGKANVIIPFAERNLEQAVPHIMPVILPADHDRVMCRIREAGIQTSKHYELIPEFTLYKGSGFKSRIEHIGQILTLPMYPRMTRGEVWKISELM